MASSVAVAADRSISIPPGAIVRTQYVDVFNVRLGSRERMAVGDISEAFQKRLQLGDNQPWPPPRGHWDGKEFVIEDGRHEWIATVMLGHKYILVAWVDERPRD